MSVEIAFPDGLEQGAVDGLGTLLETLGGGELVEAPLIAAVSLLGRSEVRSHLAAMQPPAGQGVVHESQKLERHAPLETGTPLRLAVTEESNKAARLFSFHLAGANGLAVSLETRLRFVTPEEMARFRGSLFPERMNTPATKWLESAAFDSRAVQRYLDISQDKNPIHSDPEAASAVGLADPIVPGLLVAGVGEAVCTALRPDAAVAAMQWRFMAPVPIGAVLRFGLQPRSDTTARLFAVNAETNMIAAIGEIRF
ncbi:MaoC family dehydratase [Shimia sp. SDUM112013]|uniref:MaoC family dehydratase n=1 Tax=Shimia sp. SDUM112013 TaxID=3136160 RepID=UPI0032EF42C7